MLAKVKRILQAYALARPHLRLSLKILKAKDRKGDWTYPKSGALSASRLEASFNAATNIFGKKLTSQCESTVSSWSSTGEQVDEATSERLGPSASRDEAYTLEATIAKQDCGTHFLRALKKHKEHLLISLLSRWLSVEQCRPIFISGLETSVMHKRNFEAYYLIV